MKYTQQYRRRMCSLFWGFILSSFIDQLHTCAVDESKGSCMALASSTLYPKGSSPLKEEEGCKREAQKMVVSTQVDLNGTYQQKEASLSYRVTYSKSQVPHFFIEMEADPNKVDEKGWTALHYALKSQVEMEVIYSLIAETPNFNQKDGQGRRLLHWAIDSEYIPYATIENTLVPRWLSGFITEERKIIRSICGMISRFYDHSSWWRPTATCALLNGGASPNVRDNRGEAPLHLAAKQNLSEIIYILIGAGARVDIEDNMGETALHRAVKQNSVKGMEALIYFGADRNRPDNQGNTPLHHGVEKNSQKAVELLLASKKVDLDKQNISGETALHWAVSHNRPALLESLLKAGAQPNEVDTRDRTPLLWASILKRKEIVVSLIAHKANTSATDKRSRTALHWAAQKGGVGVARELIKANEKLVEAVDIEGKRALDIAVEQGKKEMIELLLENKEEVNKVGRGGWTALHIAAAQSTKVVVELLLERGAEIDKVGKGGWTALHIAAAEGREEMVMLLLEKGANINQVIEKGWTALHIAVAEGREKIVTLLLERKIKVNMVGEQGDTALHIAAEHNRLTIAELLIEHGADPNKKRGGFFKKKPIDIAKKKRHQGIVDLLRRNAPSQKRKFISFWSAWN